MRPGGYYLAQQDLEDRLGVTFIHFSLYDASGNLRPYDALAPPVFHDVADINFVDTTMRRIVELMRQPNRNARDAADTCRIASRLMTGLLMDLDAASDRAASDAVRGTDLHHRKLVMELASRISESPKDVPPIAEMADQAGYSPDHFARVFKRVLGQSPQAYAVQAKINRACQLLTESPLTISQIADALGYEDIYFFSKQFRQKMSCTPTQYRRSGGRALASASRTNEK
jgi:AraC-like DNA-binding protein